jgi:hypothetical protein
VHFKYEYGPSKRCDREHPGLYRCLQVQVASGYQIAGQISGGSQGRPTDRHLRAENRRAAGGAGTVCGKSARGARRPHSQARRHHSIRQRNQSLGTTPPISRRGGTAHRNTACHGPALSTRNNKILQRVVLLRYDNSNKARRMKSSARHTRTRV